MKTNINTHTPSLKPLNIRLLHHPAQFTIGEWSVEVRENKVWARKQINRNGSGHTPRGSVLIVNPVVDCTGGVTNGVVWAECVIGWVDRDGVAHQQSEKIPFSRWAWNGPEEIVKACDELVAVAMEGHL